MALTTADDVRMELDVTASEYPSIEDGESEETILDKWIARAHDIVTARIPSSAPVAHRTNLETLVAAHFGYADKTGATDGQRPSSITQGSRTTNFDMESTTDGKESPYWKQAVELDPRIDDTPSDDYVITV